MCVHVSVVSVSVRKHTHPEADERGSGISVSIGVFALCVGMCVRLKCVSSEMEEQESASVHLSPALALLQSRGLWYSEGGRRGAHPSIPMCMRRKREWGGRLGNGSKKRLGGGAGKGIKTRTRRFLEQWR